MSGSEDIPEFLKSGFVCPNCHHHSEQHWQQLTEPKGPYVIEDYAIAQCNRCDEFSLWAHKKLVHPFESTAPPAHEHCPDEVKSLYEQARNVLQFSPIASCALLRLVIEKIVDSIVPGKDSLNAKIGKLVENGLDERIQQALDSIRVIGDNAVHSLQMDLQDDEPAARNLFGLVNVIISAAISTDKQIKDVYSGLPDSAKKQIKERDNSKK